jgi:hypothetical protein
VWEKERDMEDEAFVGAYDGLALLQAELTALSSNLVELKNTLIELLEAMQLQFALELGAPQTGDQTVRLN